MTKLSAKPNEVVCLSKVLALTIVRAHWLCNQQSIPHPLAVILTVRLNLWLSSLEPDELTAGQTVNEAKM
jgi:hypothetical protein